MEEEVIRFRRGADRNLFKYLAAACMLLDHVALLFFVNSSSAALRAVGIACRVLGRFACPVMCYFLAEGFVHTSSRSRYALRLLLFALISQVAYTSAVYGTPVCWEFFTDLNVLFSLLISLLVLCVYESINEPVIRWTAVAVLAFSSCICDWGVFAPILTLGFYLLRGSAKRQACYYAVFVAVWLVSKVLAALLAGAVWYGELWQAGLFLFLPVPFLYNGRRGSPHPFHKWFFYGFYPIHLALLAAVAAIVAAL